MNILEFVGVSKRYKDTILEKVSFEVKTGEKVAILGRNGAGKSTLLRIAATLETLDQGAILYKGQNITQVGKKYRREMGYVPQEIMLFEELTGTQNLDFWLNAYELEKNNSKEILSYIIEQCELKEMLNKKVQHYSGGMKRRLNMAVALLHSPQILLLDEPDVGMDTVVSEKIYHIIEEINQNYKTTCLIATHNLQKAQQLCDKIVVVEDGKVLKVEFKNEINKTHKNLEEWYLGLINSNINAEKNL